MPPSSGKIVVLPIFWNGHGTALEWRVMTNSVQRSAGAALMVMLLAFVDNDIMQRFTKFEATIII